MKKYNHDNSATSNNKLNTSNLNNYSSHATKKTVLEKYSLYPQSTKFKSPFDKEGNPFKYFMDMKKHLKSNSTSLLG